MIRRIEGKKIKFIAVDRKYRTEPYPAVAPLDSKINNYVTGQHRDYEDPSTKGYLTLKEITGEEKITPEGRRKKFSYRITDDTEIPILHNKTYDTRLDGNGDPLNAVDYWNAQFIINQTRIVAMSKSEVTPKHKFYLEDKESDAKAFVSTADEVYDAEKLIREKATLGDYKDLVMLLNMIETGFYVEYSTMSDIRLKEILIKKAQENPKVIQKLFSDEGKDLLFIAKLNDYDIIQHKPGNGYYDGQKFIASNHNEMLGFIANPENETLVGKWHSLLKRNED